MQLYCTCCAVSWSHSLRIYVFWTINHLLSPL